jgi:hypothetical protein
VERGNEPMVYHEVQCPDLLGGGRLRETLEDLHGTEVLDRPHNDGPAPRSRRKECGRERGEAGDGVVVRLG